VELVETLVLLETLLAGWTEHWQIVLGPILLGIVLFRSDARSLLAKVFGRGA
jgi:branched-chain amino acid transport system permease protein